MTDRDGNRSNPYKPNQEKCCEACVFGSGEHAAWCLSVTDELQEDAPESAIPCGAEFVGRSERLRSNFYRLTNA